MEECNKQFCKSYMLLDYDKIGLVDLISLLISPNIGKRKFVDCKQTSEPSFRRRWLIFLSIVVHKLLQLIAKPLSFVGTCVELWFSLLSRNGGFPGLLFNTLTWQVVAPDKSSSTYVSFVGNFDHRTELDGNIKRGDPRYNPALAIMAAKLSYESGSYIETVVNQHWQMEFLGFFDFHNAYQNKASTQAFLMRDKAADGSETVAVVFRGTEPFDADSWCSDVDISWYELRGVGRIHGGFMKALGLQKCLGWPKTLQQAGPEHEDRPLFAYYKIREMLTEIMSQNEKAKFFVAGHSLGGALATVFPAVLMLHDEDMLLKRLEGVYTFGQPRVGDEKFGKYMKRKLDEYGIGYYRFVYGFDIVPRLPYDDANLMFKHFGTCIFFNRNYQGQVVVEEPYKNYFSPGGTIGMIWNALMELTRSFTIAIDYGEEYSEGWLLTGVRLVGLLIPGLPAHLPRDYVNCTRLGPPHLLHSS
ncbi:unnamed protein product [Linum trigynum]|uniref:Fungal lipase-type domain-containing protein n=1 Tax=Linum trigynum TaxID=586398 RepID=A0AAV2GD67_9ROSI